MKILRIIADSDPRSGGPIEGARQFGAVWARHGHQQDLLTLDPPNDVPLTDYPGNIFALGPPKSRNPLHKYRYAPRMVPWLRLHSGDYDAIIVSGLWRYVAMGSRKALVGGKTPYYVFPHGMLDPWFRKTYPLKHWAKQLSWWFSEGPLIAGARNTLFTSQEEMLAARNAFWPYRAKGLVVSYGTRDSSGDPGKQFAMFQQTVPELKGKSYILFLSRIHRKKGCDLLVSAFRDLASAHPNLDLVIAGPDEGGLVPELRKQLEVENLNHRVHFPGMLKGDNKAGAFRGAAAFALPSHQENFGIVVAEAMSYGLPVLVSDKVNIWREIKDSSSGLVAPDNAEGTLSMLKEFLQMSGDKRAAMGSRARACFLKNFHVEKSAMDVLALIGGSNCA